MTGSKTVALLACVAIAAPASPVPGVERTVRHPIKADKVWQDLLKKCADSDLLGKVRFFGMSNNLGPGVLWRKKEGSYRLVRMLPQEILADTSVIRRGEESSCSGKTAKSSNAGLALFVGTALSVLPIDIGFDLKKASTVTVSTPAWVLDQLSAGDYEDAVRKLPSRAPYARSLASPGTQITGKAVKIKGLKAELEFDRGTAAALKAKYGDDPANKIGVDAKWTSASTLSIKSDADVYIAVELWDWNRARGTTAGATSRIDQSPQIEEDPDFTLEQAE